MSPNKIDNQIYLLEPPTIEGGNPKANYLGLYATDRHLTPGIVIHYNEKEYLVNQVYVKDGISRVMVIPGKLNYIWSREPGNNFNNLKIEK